MRIEVYHSYFSPTDGIPARLWDGLPPERRAQLAPRTPADRIAGAALSALLAHAVNGWGNGATVQSLPFDGLTVPYAYWERAENGKPFPNGILTAHGKAFVSFSHSNGHLLVALCDRPLGADIQTYNAPVFAPDRFSRLATRITHPAETPPQTPQETARRFAAKEAVLKLSGDGLRRGMNTVNLADYTITLFEDVPVCIIAIAV